MRKKKDRNRSEYSSMMTDAEIQWVNDYHTEVRNRLTPLLTADEAAWLAKKTAPLTKA